MYTWPTKDFTTLLEAFFYEIEILFLRKILTELISIEDGRKHTVLIQLWEPLAHGQPGTRILSKRAFVKKKQRAETH